MRKLQEFSANLVVILAALGVACGGIVVFADDSDTAREVFREHPQFLVWLFLILIQCALFATLPLFLFRIIAPFWKLLRANIVGGVVFGLGCLVLVAVPPVSVRLLLDIVFPLPNHLVKFAILTGWGVALTAIPASLGLYVVYLEASDMLAKSPGVKDIWHRYRELRGRLRIFLFVLGGIVALATLTTGASQRAIVTTAVTETDFPRELVLAYGGYFTVLLAFIYLPSHFQVRKVGLMILDELAPESIPGVQGWEETYERRKYWSKELALGAGFVERFEAALPIAAPLLGGLISYSLG